MINNPQVLNALKEKEREYTFASNMTNLHRSVFYFWDSADAQAAYYCSQLENLEFGQAIAIELTTGRTIEGWLRTYLERMKESQYPIHHKVYCLFVSSDVNRFDAKVLADNICNFQELNFQLIYLGTELPEGAPDNHFGACWIVNPEDVLVAKILLSDASFSYEWIQPGTWGFENGGGWYRLRAKRYSSVMDDICGQLYHKIAPIFETRERSELDRALWYFFRAMFDRINEVYLSCPHARYLPVIGYDQLCSELFGNGERWRFARRGRGTAGRRMQIHDVIRILFGTEHEKIRPEWLREQIRVSFFPIACEENIRKYERDIRDQLFQRFTLEDLYGRVAQIALEFTSRQYQLCYEIEKKLNDVLTETYIANSPDISDIWKGLERYLSIWDDYIQNCLMAAWWNAIAGYVIQLGKKYRDDFQRLKQSYSDFEDYKDNSAGNAVIPVTAIRSFSDLLNAISLSSAVTQYRPDMLQPLRQRATKLYEQTGDNVAYEKRPKIGLLLSDRLSEDVEKGKIHEEFEWKYHPRNYMPTNIIYELRMYEVRRFY